MIIIPGILTNNIDKLYRKIKLAQGLVEWIQIDFIDGQYADNTTISPTEIFLDEFKKTGLKFEAHLMVSPQNMEQWTEECGLVGFDRIMSQVESVTDPVTFIQQIKHQWGIQCGFSIDIQTPVSAIRKNTLKELDTVQIMLVKAGFSEQKTKPELLEKIQQLSTIRNHLSANFQIQVDGGVKSNNIKTLQNLQIDSAVVGSGLYFGNFEKNLQKLYQ